MKDVTLDSKNVKVQNHGSNGFTTQRPHTYTHARRHTRAQLSYAKYRNRHMLNITIVIC